MLSLAANKTDPRILNYLGYSHRKAGRIRSAWATTRKRCGRIPNYTLVREYHGGGTSAAGDVAAASEQLNEIEKRCGKGCEEYAELSAQIDAYLKG